MTLSLSLALVPGCGGSGKSNDEYFRTDSEEEDETYGEAQAGSDSSYEDLELPAPAPLPDTQELSVPGYGNVEIPFTEQRGVKLVEVNINGALGVDMIIDSGCSGTLISLAEAQYLAQKGVLTEDDIMGQEQSQIADGSITLNTVVRLRQLVIGDAILCTDVIATVSDNVGAPLLLGNEVLNRTGSYTVDNERKLLIFNNVPTH